MNKRTQAFHARLQEIITGHDSLYRVASKVCSTAKRPASISHEDHLHDAICLGLEIVRDTPADFVFPDMDPEDWLYRSIRRRFHPRAFYFREYSWSRRRIGGDLNTQVETEESPAAPTLLGIRHDEMWLEDILDLIPDSHHAFVRFLAQGGTLQQSWRVFGKAHRNWSHYKIQAVRECLRRRGAVIPEFLSSQDGETDGPV